mgnify:CR=1 FL=1
MREALVTYIEGQFDMRNTIPAGTWIFRSRIGTYNFLYPATEGERTDTDIDVVAEMAWQPMMGLTPYKISDGSVVWCEKGVVRTT